MNASTVRKQRIQWIDFMKITAMLAVLFDHTVNLLYTNRTIWYCSFFSTLLFIILSGITSYDSYERHKDAPYGSDLIRKLKAILVPYGIATSAYIAFSCKCFDLMTFIKAFLGFNGDSVFYFVLFYIQLMVISRPLCMFVSSLRKSKRPGYQIALIHLLAFLLMMYASHIFINYTFMLNVHGGGKNLFGGTFLLIYYIGIVIGSYKDKVYPDLQNLQKSHKYIYIYIYISNLIVCLTLSIVLVNGIQTKGPFFGTTPFWGGGFNPPESRIIAYAICVFGILLSLNGLIDISGFKSVIFIRNTVAWFGRYSLYIFLFHKMVLRVLNESSFSAWSAGHIWIKRFVYMGAIIGFCVIAGILIDRILKHWRGDFTKFLGWIRK